MADKRRLSYLNIFLLANKVQVVMDRNLTEVSSKQWIVLITLGTFKKAPTLKELSERCGITHQSTMALVKKLEEKGFLLVIPDELDKRALRIYFTEKIKTWTMENNRNNSRAIDEIFSDLTEAEVSAFCDIQYKIYERLEKIDAKAKQQANQDLSN